jgi:hypothetical protein
MSKPQSGCFKDPNREIPREMRLELYASKPQVGRFENPKAAAQEVVSAFNDWSSMLTNRSIEASFAVIAANWAVYGSAAAILAKPFAKWSIIAVIVFLASNLLMEWLMCCLLFARSQYAERDHNQWQQEYDETKGTPDPWPYTEGIENLGHGLRVLKAFVPLIAAVLFIVSLFCGS